MPRTFQSFVDDQKKDLPIVPTHDDLKSGTYIVTGSNTGIGFEAVKHLVGLRAKKVIIACRSVEKGNAAKAKIETETGNEGIAEVWQLDLASYSSVKAFAKKAQGLDRLDAVVQNAAVALDKITMAEGLETTLTVNVVSTILLSLLLLPKLEESAKKYQITPALSILTGGTYGKYEGYLDKMGISGDVLDGISKEPMNVLGTDRYSLSKMLLYHCYLQLAQIKPYEKTGVAINQLSPGFCVTGLNRNVGWIHWGMIEFMRLRYARSAEWGSRNLLHAMVVGPESHGRWLATCEIKDDYAPEWVSSESGQEEQKRVWGDVVSRLNQIQPGCI